MTQRLVRFAKAIIIIAIAMSLFMWWADVVNKANDRGHYEYSAELVDGNHYVWIPN